MIRMWPLSLLLFAAPVWACDALDAKALASLPNVASPAAHLATAGRLQASDIPVIAKAGVRPVIDLTLTARARISTRPPPCAAPACDTKTCRCAVRRI